ncbi:hypothetical protein D9611_004138 [Ephemerocybe angulata]|uniref:F-box domain-containing protein n=1 Tax=Ephemerocybe angulata TaxID=980116 RepID=A0A8H5BK88_9AGAR|nr:hypothetical protein D9611_004138 [Tulosesus angulatus]
MSGRVRREHTFTPVRTLFHLLPTFLSTKKSLFIDLRGRKQRMPSQSAPTRPKSKRAKIEQSDASATKLILPTEDSKLALSHGTLTGAMSQKALGKQPEHTFNFFEEIPLDILGEIFYFLAPIELLQLARTTKRLRELLMSSSSTVYWKTARQAIAPEMPPCPEGLSEPQYANLMFSDHCHKCFQEDGDLFMHVEAYVQLCDKCSLEEFKRWKELPEEVDGALAELIPATSEKLTAAERKQAWEKANAHWRSAARTRFHVKTALSLHREYKKVRGVKKKAEWLENQKALWQKTEEHANACRIHFQDQRQKEKLRKSKARIQRRIEIEERLGALGWRQEYNYRGRCSLQEAPSAELMTKALYAEYELSDEEWESIRDGMIQWMQEVRVTREYHERSEKILQRIKDKIGPTYLAYILAQHPNPIVPSLMEVAMMDDLAAPLEATPLDEELPEGVLDAGLAKIPEFAANWKANLEQSLLNLVRALPDYAGKEEISMDVLSYASIMFSCRRCEELMSYPTVLVHACFFKEYQRPKQRKSNNKEPLNVAEATTSAEPKSTKVGAIICDALPRSRSRFWKPDTLLYLKEDIYHHTNSLLDRRGLSRTTPAELLFTLNPYVQGLCRCFPSTRKPERKATRWSQAIKACRRHRSDDYEGCFDFIETTVVEHRPGYQENQAPTWSYSQCPFCHTKEWQFSNHLIARHNLTPGEVAACQQHALREPREVAYEYVALP